MAKLKGRLKRLHEEKKYGELIDELFILSGGQDSEILERLLGEDREMRVWFFVQLCMGWRLCANDPEAERKLIEDADIDGEAEFFMRRIRQAQAGFFTAHDCAEALGISREEAARAIQDNPVVFPTGAYLGTAFEA